MSTMRQRVEKLEGLGGDRTCPECGITLGGPIKFVILREGDEPLRSAPFAAADGRSPST